VSYIPASASISKSVIIFGSSAGLTSQLYALYRLAANVIFTVLSLILNYPGLKLAIAIDRGLPIGLSLPYVLYNLCVPI